MKSPESDLTVVALSNRIGYRKPIDDAWFDAQNCTENLSLGKLCSSTELASFLGCQEKYQFCNPDQSECTKLTGLYDISPPDSLPNLNPTQKAVFQLYWKVFWAARLNFQLGFIGRENLVANEYLWDAGFGFGISANLPSDHWHNEVTNWMNTSLAILQRQTITFARPPEFDIGPTVSSLDHIVQSEDPEMKFLCNRVKARSHAHMSFSMLGLCITIFLGLFLIISNLVTPMTVGYLQKRWRKGLHKRLEWIEASSFQLQRMAAEGRGVGPWTGRDEDIPRLAEFGHVFNLTNQSLDGPWNQPDCYEIGDKAWRSHREEMESVEMDILGGRQVQTDYKGVHDDRVRLLGEDG